MKLLIFENEFNEMEAFFEVFKLERQDFDYEVHSSSQGFTPFSNALNYNKILVDLKLSDKTQMEGFDILEKLRDLGYDMNNVSIITAHTAYRPTLKEKNLEGIKVMEKPLSIDELDNFLFS